MPGILGVMSLTTRSFSLRLIAWFLFAGPLGYVAYITAVVTHEIIGHGCTAWLLGGTFSGFAILPDGMGWATAWSPEHQNVVLAAGIVACTLVGILLLAVALRTAHPLPRTALLIFVVCMFEDALPYGFWNCCFVRPPGDFGRILLDLDSELLRWTLVSVFGAGYVVLVVWSTVLIFRCLESTVGPLSCGRAALIAWPFFGVAAALTWFTFDWNQLIQEIGRLPQYVGAGLQLAVAPLLVAVRREKVARVEIARRTWALSIGTAWFASLALILTLALWLRHGVSWSVSV